MILLDTCVVIDFLRGKAPAADYLNREDAVFLSAVTVAEVYQGAKSKADLRKLDKTIQAFGVLPITEPISDRGLELIRKYTLSHGILIFDALIAATALVHGLPLATLDTKHFKMIKGLEVTIPY